MITFINALPKSGRGMIVQHRGINPGNHLRLYRKNTAEYQTAAAYKEFISKMESDFTGHVPYSDAVYEALRSRKIRIVFVYRNLWDAAASLANYVRTHVGKTEFDILIDGIRFSKCDDRISEAIRIMADWWRDFSPWLDHCHASYTFEELRGAGFLLGRESGSSTFYRGGVGGWRTMFKEEHIELAKELLPGTSELWTAFHL